MQLNKYLALCGVASRRRANDAICQGRVSINDVLVEKLGVVVDTERDQVFMDGRLLVPPPRHIYILLNKPKDVITTFMDGRGRKTVLDLIPLEERIFPVGRLDMDTEGVLLLTNDGDLSFRLTHPRYEIEKIYKAWVQGHVGRIAIGKLSKGVSIDPNVIVKGEAVVLDRGNGSTLVELRLHQGKKRQVKRMMKAVGHPVIHLERAVFAGLTVNGLQRGEWRFLTDSEVQDLYGKTGLKRQDS